jgi:transcription initiation factor TFIIIB Brf1 subunit/transcription initiation factor TFIIB
MIEDCPECKGKNLRNTGSEIICPKCGLVIRDIYE